MAPVNSRKRSFKLAAAKASSEIREANVDGRDSEREKKKYA